MFSTCTLTSDISMLGYSGVGLPLDTLLGNFRHLPVEGQQF